MRSRRGAVLALIAGAALIAVPAQAQDFFSALFGAITGQPARPFVPFAPDGDGSAPPPQQPRSASSGGGQAFCVRTCDGRYFPISASSGHSRAATCSNLCPASETRVFYGSSIDRASSESGKTYSAMNNAFRYRNEIVSGCTCNGKDTFGLARIDIKDDPTLRKGDIVTGEDDAPVKGHKGERHGAVRPSSPASAAGSAKSPRASMVATE